MNFRDIAKPYQDILERVTIGEIAHVKPIKNTLNVRIVIPKTQPEEMSLSVSPESPNVYQLA